MPDLQDGRALVLKVSDWGGEALSDVPIVDDRSFVAAERIHEHQPLIEPKLTNGGVDDAWVKTWIYAEISIYAQDDVLKAGLIVSAEERGADKDFIGNSWKWSNEHIQLYKSIDTVVSVTRPVARAVRFVKFDEAKPDKDFTAGDDDGPVAFWRMVGPSPIVQIALRPIHYTVHVRSPVLFA